MTTLYAQPYDITAKGFYFKSYEEFKDKAYHLRNENGDPVEEFEIEFIDGEDIDCELSQAWGIDQLGIETFFNAVEFWDQDKKLKFIIAVGECACFFDPSIGAPDDFDVDIYQMDSLKELAEHFVDEGLYGEIPESLQFYIDTDAIARDLAVDYAETTIAGTRYVYRCCS
jgi:hypothetical protein